MAIDGRRGPSGGGPRVTRPAYVERLRRSYSRSGSLLCVGIDPVPEYLPASIPGSAADRVLAYFTRILGIIRDRQVVPGAFKPNIGFFHSLDRPREGDYSGSRTLASILDTIRDEFPEVPVILDAKRGDIARSSTNYGHEAFRCWQVDAVTVSPYMGHDSVLAVAEEALESSGLAYVLLATSNPGASDFQAARLEAGGTVDERVAAAIVEWHKRTGVCGAVVGATRPDDLIRTLKLLASAEVPVLIPGVGQQGGTVADVSRAVAIAGYPAQLARVNVSSAITHPWRSDGAPGDWAEVIARSLETFWRGLR